MSVQASLKAVSKYIGYDQYQLDDLVFRLHSQVSVIILFTFSILVTSLQYIGDPIDCIVEDIPGSVMDTYCWIHSTFTLPKKILQKVEGETAHPGVGVPNYDHGEETRHVYYQWVAFVLAFQVILFRIPRALWTYFENERLKNILPDRLFITVTDKRMPHFPKPHGFGKDQDFDDCLGGIHEDFYHQLGKRGHKNYFWKYHFCEWLNLINVLFNIVFINVFLGGMFSTYGSMVWNISNLDPEDRNDPMNLVFPKVAKCTFQRFGPSGTVQIYDGLCVLPINIFNEKIYIFLWFWFVTLAIITGLGMAYRLVTIFSVRARASQLRALTHLLLEDVLAVRVSSKLSCGDWFLLSLIGSNMDPYIFLKLIQNLDKAMADHNLGNGHVSLEKMEKIA